MSKAIVLDSSALIALIGEEEGSVVVEKYITNSEISTVNLAEVASYMIRHGMEKEIATSLLKDLAIPTVDFDVSQAFIAASLIPKTKFKGLSLGDRACLALAMQRSAMVLTGDKAWTELGLKVKIKLIR